MVGKVLLSLLVSLVQPSMGLRQTMITKNIGANMFKNMVEGDKVIIKDVDLIQELYAFCEKGKSWEAGPGNTDDLVMCCLLFGYFCTTIL